MAKIKLTKNELKTQKENLKMYRRYLPTLQLKKQQLQMEIRVIDQREIEVRKKREKLFDDFNTWIEVFSEKGKFSPDFVKVKEIKTSEGNIAGVRIPVFAGAEFTRSRYDLYETPLWVDKASERMEDMLKLDLEGDILKEQVRLLHAELRTTTQRVNLFEKIKIPETRENIRKISVYLGDQQVSAVVRGKISKSNLERKQRLQSEVQE